MTGTDTGSGSRSLTHPIRENAQRTNTPEQPWPADARALVVVVHRPTLDDKGDKEGQ